MVFAFLTLIVIYYSSTFKVCQKGQFKLNVIRFTALDLRHPETRSLQSIGLQEQSKYIYIYQSALVGFFRDQPHAFHKLLLSSLIYWLSRGTLPLCALHVLRSNDLYHKA